MNDEIDLADLIAALDDQKALSASLSADPIISGPEVHPEPAGLPESRLDVSGCAFCSEAGITGSHAAGCPVRRCPGRLP